MLNNKMLTSSEVVNWKVYKVFYSSILEEVIAMFFLLDILIALVKLIYIVRTIAITDSVHWISLSFGFIWILFYAFRAETLYYKFDNIIK